MKTNFYRTRSRVAFGAVALGALALAPACTSFKDQLLDPEQPGVIGPSQVQSATAADGLRKGALSRLKSATGGGEAIWMLGGLMTDEWKSGDTFSQRNETDQRIVQTNNANVSIMYVAVQRTRGAARDALLSLVQFQADTTSKQAQMYWVMGYAEMMLAEDFCNGVPYGITVNGVPDYTIPLTSAQGFALAQAHLDSAQALVTAADTFSVSLLNAIQITRARNLVDQGNWAAAIVATASVATSFQYLQTYSLTTSDNQVWSLNTSQKRWVVGDSFDTGGIIQNAIPFASAKDPRVPVTGTTLASALKQAFDNQTQFVSQSIYARSDPQPLATGIDARLIEAEARLQASDIPGMMTILNALRTSPQKIGIFVVPAMAALAAPGTQAAAVQLYFREKAFWDFSRGTRLGDLRRLVRQYGLNQANVFPNGQFSYKGAGLTYGTDVNFPVTIQDETPNPNWHGCIDRAA
jgi:hypothetical protein